MEKIKCRQNRYYLVERRSGSEKASEVGGILKRNQQWWDIKPSFSVIPTTGCTFCLSYRATVLQGQCRLRPFPRMRFNVPSHRAGFTQIGSLIQKQRNTTYWVRDSFILGWILHVLDFSLLEALAVLHCQIQTYQQKLLHPPKHSLRSIYIKKSECEGDVATK